MLHLRVICPTERTEQVLGALASQRGATHIVVMRDVAVHPAGDMVEADVAREAANDVVDALERTRRRRRRRNDARTGRDGVVGVGAQSRA